MTETLEAVHTHTHTHNTVYTKGNYIQQYLYLSWNSFTRQRVYSREISFICCAQNTVLVGIGIIDFNIIYRKKDGLYSNVVM